jgi:hypothetical protein
MYIIIGSMELVKIGLNSMKIVKGMENLDGEKDVNSIKCCKADIKGSTR